jgi:uncharacterized membrane protein YvbJ
LSHIVILSIILLIIILIIICLYFISRHKQKAIQVVTLETFMTGHHLNEDESQKKSLISMINDYFDHDNGDDFDDGDGDHGGDDGGE